MTQPGLGAARLRFLRALSQKGGAGPLFELVAVHAEPLQDSGLSLSAQAEEGARLPGRKACATVLKTLFKIVRTTRPYYPSGGLP
jgi:hypothetical protein